MGAGMVATEADITRLVGTVDALLMHECLRTGASVGELRRAFLIAGSAHGARHRLSPRIRRLVDLIGVAGRRFEAGTAA